MLQNYEINAKGNCLCSNCWQKLEAFHEFYQRIKVTHCNRFKLKDEQLPGETATSNSGNEITGTAEGKLTKNLLQSQTEVIKKRTLKLNSNSCQSKEIKFHIEKDGKNVRCNILKSSAAANEMDSTATTAMEGTAKCFQYTQTAAVDQNGDEESESESDSEYEDIINYPARQIKMEEELIIIDDDNCDDSIHTNTEGEDRELFREKQQKHNRREEPQLPKPRPNNKVSKCNICCKELMQSSIAEHQIRKHKMCRICKQTFRDHDELNLHMVDCKNFCHICEKSFSRVHGYRMHMKAHYHKCRNKPRDVELIKKTANAEVLKKWASELTQN